MKAIRIAALLCFCALLFCACTSQDDWHPANMKTVENENTDYTIYVPEDWTIDLTTGVTTAYDPDDRSNISVAAFSLSGDDTYISASDYWARYAADCRSTFSDFHYLTQDAQTGEETVEISDTDAGTQITLGGSAAMKYQVAMTVTGIEYHYTVVICIRGGYAYMLTYTARPDFYETHAEEVDKVITNFAFKK